MLLIDASQQLWLPSLFKQEKVEASGVRDWFLLAKFRIEDTPSKKLTKLYTGNSTDFNEALAQDILKYASATFESLENLKANDQRPNASGWIIIRSYYAAYFAANSLMRMFGYFSVNLDRNHISEIHDMAILYSVKLPSSDKKKLQAGTYYGNYSDTSGDGLITFRTLENSSGGVHQQFWSAFKQFLITLRSELILGCSLPKPDIESVKDDLKKLEDLLSKDSSGRGSYLSEIRNAVNYRLELGVWHPYLKCKTPTSNLLSALEFAFDKPLVLGCDEHDSELESVIHLSAFLVAWLRHSLLRIELLGHGSRKHFLRKGPLDLIT